MTMPKSPGAIVDLMKSNTGQMISFKAREPFKYLQLESSLWPSWLCSHVGMKKGLHMKDRRRWNRQSQMKRLRKVRRDVISHKVGRGKQVDENGFQSSELDAVSPWQGAVLSLRLLEALMVFMLLFLDLSFNCYWMAPAWGLRPVAHLQGHTDKDAQNDSTLQQQKQAQIQMQTHICLTKAWI